MTRPFCPFICLPVSDSRPTTSMQVVPFSRPRGPSVPQEMSSSISFDFAMTSSSSAKAPTATTYQPRSRPQRRVTGARTLARRSPRADSKWSFLAQRFRSSSMAALPLAEFRISMACSWKLSSFSLSVHFLRLSGFRFTVFSGGKSTVYLPFCSSKLCMKPTFPLSSGAESRPSATMHSFFSSPMGPVSNWISFQNSSFWEATSGSSPLKCSSIGKNLPKSTWYREQVPPMRLCNSSPRIFSKFALSVLLARKSFMSFLACLQVVMARDKMFTTLSLSVIFFRNSGLRST
mmetsp:Transcript_98332/g.306201  ORF Transcript_98332/g.306201 Transcript_98332/m.306201 type:complete len:290 (-) Transcript_98332:888-1757(-)